MDEEQRIRRIEQRNTLRSRLAEMKRVLERSMDSEDECDHALIERAYLEYSRVPSTAELNLPPR